MATIRKFEEIESWITQSEFYELTTKISGSLQKFIEYL